MGCDSANVIVPTVHSRQRDLMSFAFRHWRIRGFRPGTVPEKLHFLALVYAVESPTGTTWIASKSLL